MKLKFRAEPKDIVIFLLYMLLLLYLISIAIINAVAFLNEGEGFTLLPFRAFTKDYIAPTLIFYIAAVVASFASVSDYFFEREKGFGIKPGVKKDKGYSRWLKDKEMQKELKLVLPSDPKSDYAGIPIINNGNEIWVDDGEYHSLIIGSTGSGKTQMLVQPMVKVLAKKGESMIITDPKGEIYENNANELRERGYNIVLLNFRDPQKGNCWNPMTLPYSLYKSGDPDKANELLDDLARNILYDENNKSADPFWENTSADYFAGLALALFDDAKEEEINLNSINLMTTVGEEKIKGTNTVYMKEYFSTKDQSSPAYVNVSSTLMAPPETKGSILSVFKQKIKLFSSRENLSEMLSHSDFDMKDIGRKKTAVFIVIQDEKKTYHSLATIFLKQCYETLISVAQENGGKLKYRTNFILDEFANMPPLKDVTTMVTAARSRAIRFNFIIQNFSQLYDVYGKENGETIKGNCGNIIYLISSELAALEEISKMCGEEKSKKDDKTASTPLVTVSDLQRMKEGSMILIRTRCMPFKTVMKFNWEMEKDGLWGKKYGKSDYPEREKSPVPTFDLKAKVDKLREEKINSLIGDNKGMPFNPFAPKFDGPKDAVFPGFPMPKEPKPSGTLPGGLNIDEIVKRIDAQIAQLEEEEKREKLREAQEDKKNKKEPIKIKDAKVEESKKESAKTKQEKSKDEEIKAPTIVSMPETIEQEEITDDQFFDDFFYEDD